MCCPPRPEATHSGWSSTPPSKGQGPEVATHRWPARETLGQMMRFLGSQSSPCFLFLGEVNWTVPPICFPREHSSSASSSRKSSGTAVAEFPSLTAPTSAPFIPQMTVHPSFLSTVLVSEFVPAESVTASLLLSTAAQLDGELWGGLAVPHVHLFVHFSRMC